METRVRFLGQGFPGKRNRPPSPIFLGSHVGVEDRKNSKEDSLLQKGLWLLGGGCSLYLSTVLWLD